ncbi:hypothetical protein TNCV_4775571 [Trichonephila clavipes]|nr:hypothetical protein TNCV_4775571 [Trichonephila clavipes]
MQLFPELDMLDPLESTDAFDQLMSFVFGPQELQLLHTHVIVPVQHVIVPIQHVILPVQHVIGPVQHVILPVQHVILPVQHVIGPVQHVILPVEHVIGPVQHVICGCPACHLWMTPCLNRRSGVA